MKTEEKLPHLFVRLVWLLSERLHNAVVLTAPLNPQLPSAPHLHFNLVRKNKQKKQTNKQNVVDGPGGHLSSLSQPYRYDGGRALTNYMQNLCQLIQARIPCL